MDDPTWRAAPGQDLLDLDPASVLAQTYDRGAVLLRGFEPDARSFEVFTERCAGDFSVHQRSARRFVSADGTTQTVTAGCDAVPLHRERSYLPVAPDLLFFTCERPADRGGETLVCDGIELAAAMPPPVRDALAGRRFRCVTRSHPDEWARSLGTSDRRGAAAEMARLIRAHRDPELGDLGWDFERDRLELSFTAPWFRRVDGRDCFANFLLYYVFRDEGFAESLSLTFDDGSAVSVDLAREIEACAAPLTRAVRWEAGDVLVVDNRRAMHGRTAFTDVRREVHVRMGHALAARPGVAGVVRSTRG